MYPIGRSQLTLQAARFIVEKNVGKTAEWHASQEKSELGCSRIEAKFC